MSTVELHWPRESRFTDAARDAEYVGPGTFEVPGDAEEQYRERGWQDPPEGDQ